MAQKTESNEDGFVERLTIREMIMQTATQYCVRDSTLYNLSVQSGIIQEFGLYLSNNCEIDLEESENETESQNESQNERTKKKIQQTLYDLNNFWIGEHNLQHNVFQSEILPFPDIETV